MLKLAPENAEALLGLARIALKNKDAEGARAPIDRTIAAAPESLDAWLLKGELHLGLRQLEPATTAYEKALNLYPDNVAALLNLAAIRAGEGQSQCGPIVATICCSTGNMARQRRENTNAYSATIRTDP